jgi:hypothetical protein
MQTGWYREVNVKEIEGHKRQTAITVREQLVGIRAECVNQVRRILKMYGKVLPSGKLPALKELIPRRRDKRTASIAELSCEPIRLQVGHHRGLFRV